MGKAAIIAQGDSSPLKPGGCPRRTGPSSGMAGPQDNSCQSVNYSGLFLLRPRRRRFFHAVKHPVILEIHRKICVFPAGNGRITHCTAACFDMGVPKLDSTRFMVAPRAGRLDCSPWTSSSLSMMRVSAWAAPTVIKNARDIAANFMTILEISGNNRPDYSNGYPRLSAYWVAFFSIVRADARILQP